MTRRRREEEQPVALALTPDQQSPVAGLPTGAAVETNPELMYSDHLPQLFNVAVNEQGLRVLSWNIYAYSQYCGFGGYRDAESRNQQLFLARLDRIVDSLRRMIGSHTIDVIALQEGPASRASIAYFQERIQTRLSEFTATVPEFHSSDSREAKSKNWILYRTDRFENPSDVSYDRSNPLLISKQTIRLQIQGTNDSVVIHNTHTHHRDTPEDHETYLRGQHDNNDHVITVGDFNIGVGGTDEMSPQLTGRVPPEFTDGEEAYDLTDACLVSDSASQMPKPVAGTVLDPITGSALTATRSFPDQPDRRRYRACMDFASDRSSNQYAAWRQSFQTNLIVSAYDIRTGQSVIGFGFNGVQVPNEFLSLRNRDLIGQQAFSVTLRQGALASIPFYFMSKSLANFISNTRAVETGINQLSDDGLKASATTLKAALFEELCNKLEAAKNEGRIFNISQDYAYQQMTQLAQALQAISNPSMSQAFNDFISNTLSVENEINRLSNDELKASATTLKKALFEELCNKLQVAKRKGKTFHISRSYAYQQMTQLATTLTALNADSPQPAKLAALKKHEKQAKRSPSGWKKFGKLIAGFLITAVCAVVGAVIGAVAGGALGSVSGPGSLVTAVAGAVAGGKVGAAVGLSAGAAVGLGGSAALFARRSKEERLAKAFVKEAKLAADESATPAVVHS